MMPQITLELLSFPKIFANKLLIHTSILYFVHSLYMKMMAFSFSFTRFSVMAQITMVYSQSPPEYRLGTVSLSLTFIVSELVEVYL